MACEYFVGGTWVSETQFKEILNNGLLDNLIASEKIDIKGFKVDNTKVQQTGKQTITRTTVPATKLAEILTQEVKTRTGYPLNMLASLELTTPTKEERALGIEPEFKIPLWASPYASKFESILTSVVTNKVIKQKLPGNSYVLGSPEGFKIKQGVDTTAELNKSGVVFSSTFDATKGLQPMRVEPTTGKILPAQIMIPFKFRDEQGNILKVEDFTTTDESGRLILDETKIPKKLLQLFGFRIPTQERNSMAAVEIVGFLPEASGDLMLAPRDFTKQMGSDFDVDKLYTYIYNHFYKDGKLYTNFKSNKEEIKRLINITEETINDLITELKLSPGDRKLIDNYIKERIQYNEEGVPITTELAEKANELINSIVRNTENYTENKKRLNDTFDMLSILKRSYKASQQNKLLDIHLRVMTSSNPEVVASIVALDSFGEFKDLAKQVNQIRTDKGLVPPVTTILSDIYQRTKYINATAGKTGVGSFSLDSTFNALSQGKDLVYVNLNKENNDALFLSNKKPSSEEILRLNEPLVTFGNVVSKGDMSNEYTLRSQAIINKAKQEKRKLTKEEKQSLKFKSTIIRALQSSAVDNEKEQILDKLNINDETLDAIRALEILGFEETDIAGLLTQEIVSEYIYKLKDSRSSLTGYTADVEDAIYSELIKKYDSSNRLETLAKESPEILESLSNPSGEQLIDYLSSKSLVASDTTSDFNITQLQLLAKFRKLTEIGKTIKQLQSATNSSNKGVPKSLIETTSKVEQIEKLLDSKVFNADKLLGEYENGNLVKPTNINGFASKYGTMMANKIYQPFFPYTTTGFKLVTNEILSHTAKGTDVSSSAQTKNKQEVFGDIRSYLFANDNTQLYEQDVDTERKRLFIDFPGNDSLATILQRFSNQSWYTSNSFLSRLSFDSNKNGTISRINFEAATGENLDERNIYDGFAYLLIKDLPIGIVNGKSYTTRMLAQDLVAAAFLEGGNQGSKQYLKYIPVSYIKAIGFGEHLCTIPFDFINTFQGNIGERGTIYTMPSAFTRQYFQNNPDKVKQLTLDDVEFAANNNNTVLPNSFKLKPEQLKQNFVDITDHLTGESTQTQTHFIAIKEDREYGLYEFDTIDRTYKRIPVLQSSYGFVSYNSSSDVVIPIEKQSFNTTIVPQSLPVGYNNIPNIPVDPTTTFDSNVVNNTSALTADLAINRSLNNTKKALDDLINQLEDNTYLSTANRELLGLLRTLPLPDNFKINYISGVNNLGEYNYANKTLSINLNHKDNQTVNALASTIAHELIHTFTGHLIRVYLKLEKGTLTQEQNTLIENLINLQTQYKNTLKPGELEAFTEAYEQWKLNPETANTSFFNNTSEFYGASKLTEFVTMALTDEEFQKRLNEITDNSGKTVWESIKDIIAKLILSLGIDVKKDSLLENAIKNSIDLIKTNEVINNINDTQSNTQSNSISENLKNEINKIYPNWINIKENELLLASEFKTLQLLFQEESDIQERIKFGKEAEKTLNEIKKGINPFTNNTTIQEQLPNLLYAYISGKLAENNISEQDMYINLFKTSVQKTEDKLNLEVENINKKYELFPGVFANEGQTKAIDKINEFLKSDDSEFLLQGKGGTGKTTIIKKILENLPNNQILAIAPSHKAKKVLDKSINNKNSVSQIKTRTLASALSIKLDENTGNFVPDEYARKKGILPIKNAKYIIIDESSMVSDKLLAEIKQFASPYAKIIFMGDKAQLPPVGQESDSAVFNITNGYELTEKMRQAASSPIINIGTKIAANAENNESRILNPITKEDRKDSYDSLSGSSIIWENNEQKALESFVEDVKESNGDVDYVKIITFNNQNHNSPQSVKNLNKKVRTLLYGKQANEQEYFPGEILTAYSDFTTDTGKDKDETIFNNSEDLTVVSSELVKNAPFTIYAYSNQKGNRSIQVNFDVQNLTLKNSEGEILNEIVPVIAESSKEEFTKIANNLGKTDMQMKVKLMQTFAQLEYGYAITSHKAQGSTYKNVYVMEDNIMGPTNGGTIKAKNQSLYVAVSRPTTKLVMISDKNVNNNTENTNDTQLVKPGVDELFQDQSFANQVYEALGFNNRVQSKGTINVYWGQSESETSTRILSNLAPRKFIWEGREYGSVEHAYQSNKSGTFDNATYNAYNQIGGYGRKIRGKGTVAEMKTADSLGLMKKLVVESFKQNPNSEAVKKLLQYENFTHNTNELIDKAFLEGLKLAQKELLSTNQITPQQEQQAKQLYSQYIEQTGKQDIEGFKEFVSKPVNNTQNRLNNIASLFNQYGTLNSDELLPAYREEVLKLPKEERQNVLTKQEFVSLTKEEQQTALWQLKNCK